MKQKFKVEPVPQGNNTVRFRWQLEGGEQISKVPVPFIYVTKDHWRTKLESTTTAELLLSGLAKHAVNKNLYVLTHGKHAHTLTHWSVVDVPRREMNSIHPIPLVYVQAAWWRLMLHDWEHALVELRPVS